MKNATIARLGFLSLVTLAASQEAQALSCDEIMNMVNVNVPVHIVTQTMKDSGQMFTSNDIRCLVRQGAPEDVLTAAKSLAAQPEESSEPREGPSDPESSKQEDSYEQEEMIGERRRRRRQDSYDDLPEEGGDIEVAPGSTCEREIEDAIEKLRAKKPLGSSKMLFDIVDGGNCPNQTTKAHYYLARALYEMEMYHSAQHYFMEVVRKGPANQYFKHALPKLVAIARYTGDNSEIMRIVHRIPPEEYPRQAKNHLYYLMGVRLYDQERLSDARRYFGQISTKSELYLKSKYFEGIIFNQQGRLKSAVKAFRDVIRDAEGVNLRNERELQDVADLTDLSLLNVARIYYSIQRFDESSKYYQMIPRTSKYWAESLFEHSWSTFMQNDLNLSLGLLLTTQSPFYAEEEFIPEAKLLRALTFFNLCEYDEVSSQLLEFESTLVPMFEELKDFTEQYRGKEKRAMHDQAFDAYFSSAEKVSSLPPSVFGRFLRNKDLASLVRHLDIMSTEMESIDDQKALWRDSLGVHLKKQMAKDARGYKTRGGRLMLQEMDRLRSHLADLLSQSEIIRFEVVSAQRADYSYKMSNPDQFNSFGGLELDFATSVDFIYWPFNGEFWQDELGYYRYTEQGSCR
jgi:tetratricopeptide (TPR) repeat protein